MNLPHNKYLIDLRNLTPGKLKEELTQKMIEFAMDRCGGRVNRAAKYIGIGHATLWRLGVRTKFERK